MIDPVASARYSSFVPSIEYRLIAVGKGGRLSLYKPHQSLDGAPNPCHIRSNGRCQSISPAVQSIGNRRPSVVVTLLFYSFMVQSKPWVMHHTHPGLPFLLSQLRRPQSRYGASPASTDLSASTPHATGAMPAILPLKGVVTLVIAGVCYLSPWKTRGRGSSIAAQHAALLTEKCNPAKSHHELLWLDDVAIMAHGV